METPTTAFLESRDALIRIGDRRVWSIIVTIFGDLAQESEDSISGSLVSCLTDLLGIKPEATRVALHRLRKKDWIVSEKSGRESSHQLTDFGRAQSLDASARIYARQPRDVGSWCVAISKQNSHSRRQVVRKAMSGAGFVSIGNDAFFGDGDIRGVPGEFFELRGDMVKVPLWLTDTIATQILRKAYDDLNSALDIVHRRLGEHPFPSAVEVGALRILIVHCWRYLVLRNPDLPREIFPPDWPENRCRAAVFRVLDVLKKPTPEEMQKNIQL